MSNTNRLPGQALVAPLSRLLGAILFSQVNAIFFFANIHQRFKAYCKAWLAAILPVIALPPLGKSSLSFTFFFLAGIFLDVLQSLNA
jgi:hypothetical protein